MKCGNLLTTVDERVLGLEAAFLLLSVRIEADDEDAVHGHQKARKLGRVVAAVATVQRNLKQVLKWLLRLHVYVDVIGRTSAVKYIAYSLIQRRSNSIIQICSLISLIQPMQTIPEMCKFLYKYN